jgi:hypothetical protein
MRLSIYIHPDMVLILLPDMKSLDNTVLRINNHTKILMLLILSLWGIIFLLNRWILFFLIFTAVTQTCTIQPKMHFFCVCRSFVFYFIYLWCKKKRCIEKPESTENPNLWNTSNVIVLIFMCYQLIKYAKINMYVCFYCIIYY